MNVPLQQQLGGIAITLCHGECTVVACDTHTHTLLPLRLPHYVSLCSLFIKCLFVACTLALAVFVISPIAIIAVWQLLSVVLLNVQVAGYCCNCITFHASVAIVALISISNGHSILIKPIKSNFFISVNL